MTDFNIYKWRRMIQENTGTDDLEAIKKLPFNQAIKTYYGGSEPTKEEVQIFADLYFGNPTSLNEESTNVVEQAKNIYNVLLKGGYLTDNADKNAIVNRIMFALKGMLRENEGIKVSQISFSDLGGKNILPVNIGMGSARKIKDENDLETWRSDFIKKYGDIELIKQSSGLFSAPMDHPSNQQAQADFDKYAKRN